MGDEEIKEEIEYDNLQDELDDMEDDFSTDDLDVKDEKEGSTEADAEAEGKAAEGESEEDSESEKSKDDGDEEEASGGSEEEKAAKEAAETKSEESQSDAGVNVESDALRAEIERLNGLLLRQPVVAKVEKLPKEEKESEPKQTKIASLPAASDDGQEFDFVKELDMDDVSANPQVFNKVLNQVMQMGQQKAAQQLLMNIPDLVLHHIKSQTNLNNMIDQFYSENADLISVKQTVGAVANNIQAEHSDWDHTKVLREAAIKTRELLKMPAYTKASASDDSTVETDAAKAGAGKPKGKQTRSKGKIKLTDMQQEIDEL